jgi:folate-binding Fe-S cluster repair protein YgfZ
MVNYIAVGGVNFKKGCYPGQEIVARLNYLGKTKRRMYRLALNTDQIPAIGELLHNGADSTEAGKILNAAITPSGQAEALAILKIAEAEKSLSLASNTETSIHILDLPYSLDDS